MDLRVDLSASVDPAAWDGLIERAPESTVYHRHGWTAAFAAVHPHLSPLFFTVRDEQDRLVGGVPALVSNRFGLRQLLSLPYGAAGHPVTDCPGERREAVRRALWVRWTREASGLRVGRAEMTVTDPSTARGLTPGKLRMEPRETHALSLEPGYGTIWEKTFDSKVRSACRKAARHGVVVTHENDGGGVLAFDALYRPRAEAWSHHTPLPPALFPELLRRLPEGMTLLVARRGGTPVAARILLQHRDRVCAWQVVTSEEGRELQAGVLLYAESIRDACDHGARFFDFGPSGGNPSVVRFKESLGGRPEPFVTRSREAFWFPPLHAAFQRLRP